MNAWPTCAMSSVCPSVLRSTSRCTLKLFTEALNFLDNSMLPSLKPTMRCPRKFHDFPLPPPFQC